MDPHRPLVLPVEARDAERHGPVDFYLPDDVTRPRAAVLFMHGPVPAEARPTPRDWRMFQDYGSLTAGRGLVGAVVDHRLHSPLAYPPAADDVRAAAESLRAHPAVDAGRVALWFFSGGALLSADWLRDPPPWLRCVALTYPLLVPPPGWPVEARFRPVEAVTHGDRPLVLTRVGRENPQVAEGVAAFVGAARRERLTVVDVPRGRHGFDCLDDDDESREAISRAVDLVRSALS